MQGKEEPGTSAIIHFVNEWPQLQHMEGKWKIRENVKRERQIKMSKA